jgi:rhodanese-related sulfurtransferase
LQDRSKTYLLYAGVGNSSDTGNTKASIMAGYMRNMGFTTVYHMTPGTLTDWSNAGYPTTIMGPPLVVSTAPPNGANGVQLNSNIAVTFSEAMNTAAAQGAFSIDPSVAGSFTWNQGRTAMTFDPVSNLSNNTPYTATVGTAAADTSGNYLAAPYSFSFSTGTSTTVQVVTGLSTSVTAGGSIISGTLTSLGSSSNVTVSFEYGTSTSYGATAANVTLTAPGTFTANVTGLTGNQVYHYRATAAGAAPGNDASFITCSTAQQASALIAANAANPNFAIIDVRTPAEYTTGYIVGAINIDRNSASFQSMLEPMDRTKTYLVYCGSGIRSVYARDLMTSMGFQTIHTIVDGLITWKALGYPLAAPTPAPAVLTGLSTDVHQTWAIIGGNLTGLGNAASVTVSFEYGTSTSYGATTANVTLTAPGAFTANVTGLTGNQVYHYRATAAGNGTVTGADASLITCSTAQQASALIAANAANPNFAIIDVRTPAEYATGYIAGAININRNAADFQTQLQPLARNLTYLVYCGSGVRSAAARDIMAGMGFQTIYTIVDGLTTYHGHSRRKPYRHGGCCQRDGLRRVRNNHRLRPGRRRSTGDVCHQHHRYLYSQPGRTDAQHPIPFPG